MSDNKGIIDQIFELKEEYHSIKDMIDLKSADGQELDFQPMYYPDLLRIRKDLSCLSMDLAKETSKYLRAFRKTEAKRKTQFYLSKSNGINEGLKIGSAEAKAEVEIGELRKTEAVNDGLYSTGRLILNQVNEVLKSINQDIAILRKEYESINNIQ